MRARPYIERGMLVNQTKFVGETTALQCYELKSATLPDFRWLKGKQNFSKSFLDFLVKKVEDNHKYVEVLRAELHNQVSKNVQSNAGLIYGIELVLQNLTKNDSGWYTCSVSNHFESDFLSMYLNVVERKGKTTFT